jgi:hypothetical protein
MEENKGRNNLQEFLRLIQERIVSYVGAEDVVALKAFIHGYLQGLFQNKIPEMSFPKYGWFSVWVYGRLGSELGYGDGWDAYINNICQGEQIEGLRLFYELYEEFSQSQPICYSQKLDAKKKIFTDAPRGPFWPRLNDTTTELLMFELPPSRSAWCLFLSADKVRLNTVDAESIPLFCRK